MHRSSLPMPEETCGQSKFALYLSQERMLWKGCGSAGTASMLISISTSLAHWMWAYATGLEK